MGVPLNGWFLLGKVPLNGWWLGVPLFQETPGFNRIHTYSRFNWLKKKEDNPIFILVWVTAPFYGLSHMWFHHMGVSQNLNAQKSSVSMSKCLKIISSSGWFWGPMSVSIYCHPILNHTMNGYGGLEKCRGALKSPKFSSDFPWHQPSSQPGGSQKWIAPNRVLLNCWFLSRPWLWTQTIHLKWTINDT